MGSSPSPSNHAHLHSLHPLASEHHSRPTLSFYLNSSLATTSRRYYTSIWSLYCSFSANSHVFPINPNDSHIALFLSNLAQHPPHARSILRIVAVLKYAFAYNNIRWKPDPRTSLVIRGIAKTAPPCNPLIREPFLPSHFQQLLALLDLSISEDLQIATLSALALFLALRPCEVVAINHSDLSRDADGTFSLKFSRLKSRYQPKLEIRRLSCTLLSTLLDQYISRSPLPRSRLFPSFDASIVNTIASDIGTLLNVPNLHGQSFRIGCATALSLNCFPALEIKVWGDWRSKAYLRYVRSGRRHDSSHDPIHFFPRL